MYLLPKPQSIVTSTDRLELNGKPYKEYILSSNTDKLFAEPERYRLEITPDGINILAGSDAGISRAHATLHQLLYLHKGFLPCLTVYDAPRFPYRGFMLDSARHMQTVEEIKKIINAAWMFKFNVFHWHISDDQGFRIELDSLSDITEKGSMRTRSDFNKASISEEPYGGYYTKLQMREIVEYCHERHITVIPELDMPGHVTSILHARPELSCTGEDIAVKTHGGVFKDILCAGNEASFEVMFAILDELCEIFTDEYIHIGGDEAPKLRWQNCPKCNARLKSEGLENYEQLQGWFMNRVKEYLKGKGKKAIVWNESEKGGNLDKDYTMQRWMDGAGVAIKWANNGGKLICSPFKPYYVDYPYAMSSLNSTYMYEPFEQKGLTETGKDSIVGVESPAWAEHINSFDKLTYQCFPRWLAVAETGWTQQSNKNLSDFLPRAEYYCDLLGTLGIKAAPFCEVNPNPLSRGGKLVKFFTNSISKQIILDFINPGKEHK